jgi:hypothetical protein
MNFIEVTPSYGRDYTSAKAARADWWAGKDFTIASFGPDMGRQVSCRDGLQGAKILIRFAKLRKVAAL